MKKIFYTLTAAVLCLTACHKEMTESIPAVVEPEMATVTVPFTVTIPVSPEAVTRADRYLLNKENPAVYNMYVAVFGENGGMLQQFVPATLVEGTLDQAGFAHKCKYTAQLPLYDDECHLHFIANYDGDISSLTFDYEKDFMDKLSKTIVTTEYTSSEDETKKYHPITSMPDAYWQKVVLEGFFSYSAAGLNDSPKLAFCFFIEIQPSANGLRFPPLINSAIFCLSGKSGSIFRK